MYLTWRMVWAIQAMAVTIFTVSVLIARYGTGVLL